MENKACRTEESNHNIFLISPFFSFCLNISDEYLPQLNAFSVENRICGRTLDFGNGIEFAIDIDSANRRIYIDGWKVKDASIQIIDPNQDDGYIRQYYRPNYNDAEWDGYHTPVMFEDFKFPKDRYKWARTHVFLPEDIKGQKVTLFLGGFGLLDFGWMRVFLNGEAIGTRKVEKRWHEPGCFVFDPSTPGYSQLRFGQDNIIVLQLTDYRCRTRKLDEFDPLQARELSTIGRNWPGQFEQYLTAGEPLLMPKWIYRHKNIISEGSEGRVEFILTDEAEILQANILYAWNDQSPTLHKTITIQNHAQKDVRIINVRLGQYQTNAESTEGEQGFPVYSDGCFFMTVAHPSGWTTGQDGIITLKQYPGTLIKPGDTFTCMETVYGVSDLDQARSAFIKHMESRMRRVIRGHNKPISILESFGSWPIEPLQLDYGHYPNEKAILNHLEQYRQSGCKFDYYCIEFWNDYHGDLTRPGCERFSNGFDKIKEKLGELDTALGLWIDTSAGRWSIGGNPVIKSCRSYNAAAYERTGQEPILGECYCRAQEPYKSMFQNAFLQHVRENKVRLLKFDDAMAVCHNPNHNHLPGVYSTEAIQNSEIEFLQALDNECPDLFIILYWGHRSPWWLLYADTLFESGLFLEASTPAAFPTLYARDGVILTLDQATVWCEDVPQSGKDSLGIWLTDWAWNSSIHTERWQEALIMDICRGNLLFQLWSDDRFLTPDEQNQVSFLMELFQNNKSCFENSKRILGNPWNYEPYGYFCCDGKRAYLSMYNCSWSDITVRLEPEKWGLPMGVIRDYYKWYPHRAKLEMKDKTTPEIAMRPFEVIFLEIAPQNETAISDSIPSLPMKNHFLRSSVKQEISIRQEGKTALRVGMEDFISQYENRQVKGQYSDVPKRILETPDINTYQNYDKKVFTIETLIFKNHGDGMIFIAAQMKKDGLTFKLNNLGMHFAAEAEMDSKKQECHPVIGNLTYAVPWQGWRIPISRLQYNSKLKLTVTAFVPKETKIDFMGYFIPAEQ